jgi:tetratricopeptide (TPR) repeat protein
LIAVTLAGFAGWAEINRREANAQRLLADQQREEANTQRQLADQRRQEAERNFAVAKQAANSLVFDIAQGLRDVEGMRTETVRTILGRAEEAIDRLVQGAGNDFELLRLQSAMFSNFADTYAAQGDTVKQLASARAASEILKRLTKADPSNALWQRDLTVSYNGVGAALVAQGNLPDALKSFRDGVAITERLAKADPSNVQWRNDLQSTTGRIGALAYRFVLAGDFTNAFDAVDQVVPLATPDQLWLHGNRAHALMFLGRVEEAPGDLSWASRR